MQSLRTAGASTRLSISCAIHRYGRKDVAIQANQQLDRGREETVQGLYRTATLLDTTRTGYADLFRKYGKTSPEDRFCLLYVRPEDMPPVYSDVSAPLEDRVETLFRE